MTKQATQVLLSLAALIIVAAGVFYYFYSKPKSSETKQQVALSDSSPSVNDDNIVQSQSTEQQKVEPESTSGEFKGSFSDLLGLNKTQKCTYSIDQNGVKMDGTVYLDSNRIASTASTNANGMDLKTNMVGDKTKMRVWTNLSKTGYVIDLTIYQDKNAKSDPQTAKQAETVMQDYNYKCDSWTLDESVFVVPSDIKFVEN